MPLYRQAQQYARCGVSLSPSTLGQWSAFALDVLAPVAKRIHERVLGSYYLRADDTGMRVLDQDHPAGGQERAHLGLRRGRAGVVRVRTGLEGEASGGAASGLHRLPAG
nr:IS66 family transposase [Sorangium cellulosum]